MPDNYKLSQLPSMVGMNPDALIYVVDGGSSLKQTVGSFTTDLKLALGATATATQATVNLIPNWVRSSQSWVLIDVGTTECEVRKIDSISGSVVNWTGGLAYSHSVNDTILFTNNSDLYGEYFGATGNGTTDDGPSLQAIIDASANGYGKIVLSEGTFKTSNQLRISTNNINISGAGRDRTIISPTTSMGSNPIIYCENTSSATSQIYYTYLSDFTLDLSSASGSVIGIKFDREIEPIIERVFIKGSNDHISGSQTALYLDGYGDQSTTWGGGLRLEFCRIHGVKYGIIQRNQSGTMHLFGNWILGCSVIQTGSIGITIGSNTLGSNMIIGNEIESWDYGIYENYNRNVIVGNRFENCSTATLYQVEGFSSDSVIMNVTADTSPATYARYNNIIQEGKWRFGGPGANEPTFELIGLSQSGGPKFDIYHASQDTNTPVLRIKGVGNSENDDFGDSGPSVEIVVPIDNAATNLNIGTILSGSIVFQTASTVRASITGAGVFIINNGRIVVEHAVTASRPSSPAYGQMFFDTTLGIPIWYNNALGQWVSASGIAV